MKITLSCLTLRPQTVASQAPLSKEFSRQEYWGELPLPSPGDIPDTAIESRSPTFRQVLYPWAAREAAIVNTVFLTTVFLCISSGEARARLTLLSRQGGYLGPCAVDRWQGETDLPPSPACLSLFLSPTLCCGLSPGIPSSSEGIFHADSCPNWCVGRGCALGSPILPSC